MVNRTTVSEFLLLGFSDIREQQILYSMVFLLIYLAAVIGNLLIIAVVALDCHLRTPMYFFLFNLSFLDLCYISVTIPKMFANSLTNSRSISFFGCVTQVFLVISLAATECAFLSVMAYDRYTAICFPLHYRMIMSRGTCAQMAAGSWVSGFLYSVLHTGNTFRLPFCHSNVVGQFFCDIPQLLKLSCSDTYSNKVVVVLFGVCLALGCFVFIIMSYIQIFSTVLKIPSMQGRRKAFSTCLPHLVVIGLFFGTGSFVYMRQTSMSSSYWDLLASVLYAVLPPLSNPIIYSLRNKEIREALGRVIARTCFSKEWNVHF
ncbi:olfactory receptor 14A16-like [Trachemys scripta elegans]|uniref:olfactory receptor 14A16-like n=1 Tax=Trachemys scripta elegans TaxID=31138 RepID=UPI001556F301|nr:olfactory receptor 14A16-like [Trachemys scripta elegans]